jgi:hypothetical protein
MSPLDRLETTCPGCTDSIEIWLGNIVPPGEELPRVDHRLCRACGGPSGRHLLCAGCVGEPFETASLTL